MAPCVVFPPLSRYYDLVPTKRTKPQVNSADLELEVQDYLQHRSMRERSEWKEKTAKAHFMDLLAALGQSQTGGHRVLMLNEPLPYVEYKGGKSKQRSISGIRRMRRESQRLDLDRAMALVERKGLTAQCTETVTQVVLNEDALLAAAFEGKITDKELKGLYDESETFAFYLVDEGGEDDDGD